MEPTKDQNSSGKKDRKTFEVEDYEQILDDTSSQKKSSRIKSHLIILVIIAFFATLIFLLVFTIRGGFVPIRQNLEATDPETETITSVNQKLDQQNQIKKFKSVRELENYLENNSSQQSYGLNYDIDDEFMAVSDGIGGAWQTERSMSEVAAPVGMGRPASQKSTDFSKTNVQVEGVDEADIIKTDGEYVYALANKTIFLIKAYPANSANIVSTIELDDRPINIYLGSKTLAVFGNNQQISSREFYKNYQRKSAYSFFKIFDISDKEKPRLVKDLSFEGSYQNSRMIGDYVYFLTATPSRFYEGEIPVPRILDQDRELFEYSPQDSTCKNCPEVFYVEVPEAGYQLVSVNSINIRKYDRKISSQVYLLPHTQNMFVSLKNLYLTYTKYLSENDLALQVMTQYVGPKLSKRNQEKITLIKDAQSFILTPAEKQAKAMSIYSSYIESLPSQDQKALQNEIEQGMKELYGQMADQLETTVIHKIGIDNNKLKYQGYGQVPGSVLNQFSMDEYGDYFRIATTKNRIWSGFIEDELMRQSYNNLYVLDETMTTVGALERLAIDERIYSVRFMQNRAYMVTFKETDPLFVIDLKKPSQPKVLGQLKVPGFSNYLHPYDEDLLIGLGKETQENSRGRVTTKGLKLSLFNVSDVSNPVEVDKYVFEENSSNSIARDDHKAFLLSKEKSLLSIPVSMYEYSPLLRSNRKIFRGAYVFNVDHNGFSLKGSIEHTGQSVPDTRMDWCGDGCYSSTVRRSLYIDDLLYTFSDNYLKINEIDDLDLVGSIELD
jgi:inhibitor of cysteine peptidase